MKSGLEQERKFLIKLPLSQEAKEIIIDKADAPAHIVQTYLQVKDGVSERIRMVSVEMWGRTMAPHYYHTTKKFISPGVCQEDEEQITRDEYQRLLATADPSLDDIVKTRYYVTWVGMLFELDLFHAQHDDLAILEIELIDMEAAVELPPFLEVIREVTAEKEYSNAALATKKS